MKKAVLAVVGALAALFAVFQGLQATGMTDPKTFTPAGIAFILLGIIVAAACFAKAIGEPAVTKKDKLAGK